MNLKKIILATAPAVLCAGTTLAADFDFGGHFRYRYEQRDKADFNGTTFDKAGASGAQYYRLRPHFKVSPTDKLTVLFEPQVSKRIGDTQLGNTTVTSGGTADDTLFVHRAFVEGKVNDSFTYKVGRQGFKYGDQLVLSTLEWSNVARSWDALKLSAKYNDLVKVDAFVGSLGDADTSIATDNQDLYGIYSQWSFNQYLKEFDLYLLQRNTISSGVKTQLNTNGLRFKSKIGAFDYRAEFTFQQKEVGTTKNSGQQYDIELGYSFPELKNLRVAAEYFVASEKYDQMYPLGHAYLGIADYVKRQDIVGYAAHLKMNVYGKSTLKVDYHNFTKKSVTTNDDIGSEIDVVMSYPTEELGLFSAGLTFFSPGELLKDSSNKESEDTKKFAYLQYVVKF